VLSGPLSLAFETRLGALELGVDLEVQPGGCLALAGPSGAGKTSVLRVAAGLLRPERGRATCGGTLWLDTERGVDLPPEARHCGYVFQDYALFGHLSAWRNVAFAVSGGRAERRRHAHELLERFGLGDRADAPPRELSGGERQRVALARALARRPSALLLDEPLTALDTRTRAAASRELKQVLTETEVPALLVTHDFAEAALLGDEVGVVDSGRVLQRGSAGEIAAAPASAFVADFTGAAVLTGTARRGERNLTVVTLDGGGEVVSTDRGEGAVAVSVFPWEIELAPTGSSAEGSARNRLAVDVLSVTAVGNRVRVGLATPQPLAAEVTGAAAHELELRAGARVEATFKATATRLVKV